MPKVYNLSSRKPVPEDAVYIGRPTIWGNPFIIGRDGTREEVIRKYERMLASNARLRELAQRELRGRDLACHCAPQPCHGDILLRIANA